VFAWSLLAVFVTLRFLCISFVVGISSRLFLRGGEWWRRDFLAYVVFLVVLWGFSIGSRGQCAFIVVSTVASWVIGDWPYLLGCIFCGFGLWVVFWLGLSVAAYEVGLVQGVLLFGAWLFGFRGSWLTLLRLPMSFVCITVAGTSFRGFVVEWRPQWLPILFRFVVLWLCYSSLAWFLTRSEPV